ncbi:MAG: PH domain-containing protein [Promethearchaeota archaeon]
MSKNDLDFQGKISRDYAKKQILKESSGYFLFYASSMILTFGLIYVFEAGIQLEWFLLMIFYFVLIPYVFYLILTVWYEFKYVKMFSFGVLENNLVIRHGVFNRVKATIPYSRIQNINITNGVFDRMYKTFTVKIETAGSSSVASANKSGIIRPEGYIPGVKDPNLIENKIKERLMRYSAIPSGLEDKIFKPEELAFDNFISYILSKMREGEKLRTSIKERREDAKLTAANLAEKVGVPINTIVYLEEGKYNPSLAVAYKIAEVLNCKIEDLFKLA